MPLGNQADLSPRAIEVLSSVDAILAEDTRVAEQNLRWRGIRTPVVSCYQQNEPKRAREVRERLLRGDRLALISDAGTPLISDPGYLVVQAAREIGAHLQAIPGPSAVMLSLMLSAFPVAGFRFRGFVPRKASERDRFMSEVLASQETTVLFEASSRLTALLRHVERIATDRQIAVCKDLTKRSETVFRGSAAAVLEQVSAQADARGEYTIVVAAGPESTQARRSESESTDVFIEALLRADCPIAPIVQASAELWGVSKQEAYRRTLAWKKAARHRAGGEEGQQGQ
jgi:16S rRNA (cytidine1402-2'-O)-methyltransferase